MDHDELENFITHGAADFEYDSGDSSEDLSDVPFEVEAQDEFAQTRGMNVSGHMILNFVGILTRQRHQLKSSSIHKYLLQRLVHHPHLLVKPVSLFLYPEEMISPSIFG